MSYESRYGRYVAYCRLVGSPPREFEWWLHQADNLDAIRSERVREFEDRVA